MAVQDYTDALAKIGRLPLVGTGEETGRAAGGLRGGAAGMDDFCEIQSSGGRRVRFQVVGFRDGRVLWMPLEETGGLLEREPSPEGLKRSVVAVAPSDAPAPLRIRAALVLLAAAEYFRDRGRTVLLAAESVTRLAMAQREIGVAAGEPATPRKATPKRVSSAPENL